MTIMMRYCDAKVVLICDYERYDDITTEVGETMNIVLFPLQCVLWPTVTQKNTKMPIWLRRKKLLSCHGITYH